MELQVSDKQNDNTVNGEQTGYGFGTFQGVFTPSILTIIGVVMYLRFGWMLGNVGLATSLVIVTIGSVITFLTGLSISALATNMKMKGGGAYFMLSRSLGLEAGAALGIPLALSQAIGVSFYVAGFAEALVGAGFPLVAGWDPRIVGLATLVLLAAVATISANIALKTQYFIMAAIAFSLVSFFLGGTPEGFAPVAEADAPARIGFWPVFAVFFPAVTGILSGVGMSGDLKNPARSIPVGTIAAVLVGYVIYMSVPIALERFVGDAATLRSDTMILQKCARWGFPILLGVWAATLSSAIGSFLCAPRVLQALSRDRLLPSALGRGYGKADDPRLAAVLCFCIAGACIWLGDINIIAPVLTLFNLSTYGLLNLCAGFEEALGNPSWRPTFRVKALLSFLGFAACLAAMFMISPGWTFVALACETLIFWIVKRRQLRAQWGDMRTGLYMALVRFAFTRLVRDDGHAERNWRPNLLIMSALPDVDARLLELAKGVSGGRSLVTLASVLSRGEAGTQRAKDLRESAMRTAERFGLDAAIKLIGARDDWEGMTELVQTYGFGPIVPNTIMLGFPKDRNADRFADFMRLMVGERRNVLVTAGDMEMRSDGYIDIWWRGKNANGALMLSLAFLLQRDDRWRRHPLRINMIVRNRTHEEAKELLSEFLENARVEATTRIVESEGRPFEQVIADNSSDTAVTFLGLRAPAEGESAAEYGRYFMALHDGLKGLSFPVFSLAAEEVDFRRIFT